MNTFSSPFALFGLHFPFELNQITFTNFLLLFLLFLLLLLLPSPYFLFPEPLNHVRHTINETFDHCQRYRSKNVSLTDRTVCICHDQFSVNMVILSTLVHACVTSAQDPSFINLISHEQVLIKGKVGSVDLGWHWKNSPVHGMWPALMINKPIG